MLIYKLRKINNIKLLSLNPHGLLQNGRKVDLIHYLGST